MAVCAAVAAVVAALSGGPPPSAGSAADGGDRERSQPLPAAAAAATRRRTATLTWATTSGLIVPTSSPRCRAAYRRRPRPAAQAQRRPGRARHRRGEDHRQRPAAHRARRGRVGAAPVDAARDGERRAGVVGLRDRRPHHLCGGGPGGGAGPGGGQYPVTAATRTRLDGRRAGACRDLRRGRDRRCRPWPPARPRPQHRGAGQRSRQQPADAGEPGEDLLLVATPPSSGWSRPRSAPASRSTRRRPPGGRAATCSSSRSPPPSTARGCRGRCSPPSARSSPPTARTWGRPPPGPSARCSSCRPPGRTWGIDGFGDTGPPNIMNPYDAVPSAARLLCADGAAGGGQGLPHRHLRLQPRQLVRQRGAHAGRRVRQGRLRTRFSRPRLRPARRARPGTGGAGRTGRSRRW